MMNPGRSATGASATIAPALPNAQINTASPWPVFWVASVAVFLVSMDGTMLFAAFSALRAGFPQATAADLSWVLNAYTVAYAATLIPSGGLADKHGRKKVFLAGVGLFLAASVACGLAVNVGWLVAARVLQAIGAALLTPSSLSLVLAAFPISKRAVAISLWGAVGALAAAVGPSLGAFVIASIGWQWAFYLNVPLGLAAMWRGATLLTETKQHTSNRPLDLFGMGLLTVGTGALALSIVQSESPGWSRHELLGIAGIGLMSIAGFVAWARVATAPLVDLGLFSQPDLPLRQSRNVEFRHCVFDDVLRLLFLHEFDLALLAAIGRACHHARAAAGDSGGHPVRSNRESAWPPPIVGGGQPALRDQCSVVLARARS